MNIQNLLFLGNHKNIYSCVFNSYILLLFHGLFFHLFFLFFFSFFFSFFFKQTYIFIGRPIRNEDLPPVYPDFDSMPSEIEMKSAIELAREKTNVDGRRRFVLLQIGRSTCKWCRMLKDFFHNNVRVKEILEQDFEIILINNQMNGNKEMIKQIAPNLKHAPWLVILEPSSKTEAAKKTGDELGTEEDEEEDEEKKEKNRKKDEEEKKLNILKRIGAVSLGSFPSDVLEKGMGYNPSRVLNFLSSGHTYKMEGTRVVKDSVNWKESLTNKRNKVDEKKEEL